jgi:hypothetical protein
MSIDDVRPIISGLVGGALAVALSAALSRRIPKAFRGKSANALLREFRTPIKVANWLCLLGLLSAIVLYRWAEFSSHDWRPLGLGFGLMLSTPLVVLPLSALLTKRAPSEAVVAYCLSQKMPVTLMLVLLVSGIPLLLFSAWSLLT